MVTAPYLVFRGFSQRVTPLMVATLPLPVPRCETEWGSHEIAWMRKRGGR